MMPHQIIIVRAIVILTLNFNHFIPRLLDYLC